MVNPELSNLIKEIRDILLNDKLSDDALIALSRSYISMQNLVVANNLDSEYGNRKEFEKALDILYRICFKRCQPNQTFVRRCRMTPMLYVIVYMQMRGVDMRKSEECRKLMWQVVDEWMKRPDTHADKDSVYGVLRCVTNLYYYTSENDRNNASEFMWFKQRVSDWAALMNNDCRWNGISSGEALCRIEVMSRNSNMFLDTSYDKRIERASISYCTSILEGLRRSNGMSLRNFGLTLFMLYEVIMWGIGVQNSALVNEIAESAKNRLHNIRAVVMNGCSINRLALTGFVCRWAKKSRSKCSPT